MKPNGEQAKKFWKKFGFSQERVKGVYDIGYSNMWKNDKGYWHSALPPITLDNLFKYAVPKLEGVGISRKFETRGERIVPTEYWSAIVTEKPEGRDIFATMQGVATDKDPALALFWAIYSVFDKSPREVIA